MSWGDAKYPMPWHRPLTIKEWQTFARLANEEADRMTADGKAMEYYRGIAAKADYQATKLADMVKAARS